MHARDLPPGRALRGEIGHRVSCAIYERRSTTCREFGDDPERCDVARALQGLSALEEPYSFFALGPDPHRN